MIEAWNRALVISFFNCKPALGTTKTTTTKKNRKKAIWKKLQKVASLRISIKFIFVSSFTRQGHLVAI